MRGAEKAARETYEHTTSVTRRFRNEAASKNLHNLYGKESIFFRDRGKDNGRRI